MIAVPTYRGRPVLVSLSLPPVFFPQLLTHIVIRLSSPFVSSLLTVISLLLVQHIIGDIEHNTDKANQNIRIETDRAEHVSKTSGACWLYITICLLILAMVGLIIALARKG
jgi:hypothetical protein